MIDEYQINGFKCKMGIERQFFRIPNNVAIVASINGKILEVSLIEVLKKVKKMHPLLGVRVVTDSNQDAWFTDEGVATLPLKVITRKSDNQWIDIVNNEYAIRFDFENGPLIRFILLKSTEISDLIIICQHSICDGISLSNLIQDIIILLNEPETKVKKIEPILPTPENFPENTFRVKLKLQINKFFVNRINKEWNKQEVIFDEEDYQNIHEAYYNKYENKIITAELSESQTSTLITKCHQNHVTVNSALSVAFLAGRHDIRGKSTNDNHHVNIPVNIRNQLKKPAKNVFGFLISHFDFEFEYLPNKTFWDNVSAFHQKVWQKQKENKTLESLIRIDYINPTLMDASNFAMYGRWVSDGFSRYEKISNFIQSENKALELSNKEIANIPGLIISNLGQIKPRKTYGNLKIKRLYLAGSSNPFLDLVVAGVTASGKLTLTLNYMKPRDDKSDKLSTEMEKIMNKTIENLNKAVSVMNNKKRKYG